MNDAFTEIVMHLRRADLPGGMFSRETSEALARLPVDATTAEQTRDTRADLIARAVKLINERGWYRP